jgi:hypothetical protein
MVFLVSRNRVFWGSEICHFSGPFSEWNVDTFWSEMEPGQISRLQMDTLTLLKSVVSDNGEAEIVEPLATQARIKFRLACADTGAFLDRGIHQHHFLPKMCRFWTPKNAVFGPQKSDCVFCVF